MIGWIVFDTWTHSNDRKNTHIHDDEFEYSAIDRTDWCQVEGKCQGNQWIKNACVVNMVF